MTDTTSGVDVRRRTRARRAQICPLCGRKRHDRRYRRRASARREALLRDASDPDSELSERARTFIRRTGGYRVPPGWEVSHEEPLYTLPRAERCTLDAATNMKTQPRSVHRKRHEKCGDQFHEYPIEDYQH